MDNVNKEKNAVELSEQDAASVSGGVYSYTFPNEDGPEFDGLFRYKIGDHVEYITGVAIFNLHEFTDGCKIMHRSHNEWNEPCYQCSGLDTYPLDEYTWLPERRFQ